MCDPFFFPPRPGRTTAMPQSLRRHWPVVGLVALLWLTWIAYHPGLSGGFLFDDFVNLDALGNSGPVDNWRTFWRYLTSGTADPFGRPISLLSFLIDGHDWPTAPWPFLRTNVLLHLCNGVLLFALLRRLGRTLDGNDRNVDAAALLAAGLWLLHPLFVSTTLYIVQREAMLPATFTLLGLLAYASGRARYLQTGGRSGLLLLTGGIVIGTGLAMLCKANGLLLPLLAWALEATVYANAPNNPLDARAETRLRWCKRIVLILPSLIAVAYIAHYLTMLDTMPEKRHWTIGQRLLTEPRVLLDYLKLLFVPRSISTGLYNDDYVASLGLLRPFATLPALLLVIGLIVAGFSLRRRAPALSAALLFFFAGHVLESTAVPLELYFEHRNYLPALLLFWPIARGLCALKVPRAPRLAIAFALLAVFAITTHQRAELWGQPDILARLWVKQNPDSSRAQATAAIADIAAGRPQQALQRLQPLRKRHPHDLQIAFNAVDAACASGGLRAGDIPALTEAVRHADSGLQLISPWSGNAVEAIGAGQCPGLMLSDIDNLIDAALQNPALDQRTRDEDIEPVLAQIAMHRQQPDLALLHFDRALAAFVRPDVAARQASALASGGYYRQALAHLDNYERLKPQTRSPAPGMPQLHAKVLQWQDYWPNEMAILRAKLHAEIDAPERTSDTQRARITTSPESDSAAPAPLPL